jgi:ParB family chromosome partitioning protein
MNIQRRLGRGLEALLGQPLPSAPIGDASVGISQPQADLPQDESTASGPMQLSVYDIDSNPYQPRQDFDAAEIDALAQSIREHGIIQAIVVRRAGQRYELIAGERRLRAAIQAGCSQIPAQVREADDRQMAELAIIENLQRKDLNALEKAASFQSYIQMYDCTQEELAARLSLDRSTIANLIRLLELPEALQKSLRSGAISAGHARALLSLGDEEKQIAIYKRISSEGLSVRAVEELVQESQQSADEGAPLSVVGEDGQSRPAARTRSKQVASLEQEFRSALGAKVQISQTAKGRGKIVIHFANHEEFDRIRAHLTGSPGSQVKAG